MDLSKNYYDTHVYRPNKRKGAQLIIAGFVASLVMVLLSYLLPVIGIDALDFAAQYGSILNGQVHPGIYSGLWWAGMVWHLINGTVIFSILFDFLTDGMVLPQQRWTKSIIYGVLLWILSAGLIAPLAGEGFFFRNMGNPIQLTIATFACWMVYSLVLDGMTRVRAVHQLGILDKRAA